MTESKLRAPVPGGGDHYSNLRELQHHLDASATFRSQMRVTSGASSSQTTSQTRIQAAAPPFKGLELVRALKAEVDRRQQIRKAQLSRAQWKRQQGSPGAGRTDAPIPTMAIYADDPLWDDVVPIPQDDGEGALAAIAYSEEYAEATSYLRAVMAMEEKSQRALQLTTHLISLNPAHYTVWLYRFAIIDTLSLPLSDELAWLNSVALDNQKNYQIWHHRQLLITKHLPTLQGARDEITKLGESEIRFMDEMFEEDAKNYHVWSYRQWLVRAMALWGPSEVAEMERWIARDVRNNSAWSHRFFVVFSDPAHATVGKRATDVDEKIPQEVVAREIAYLQDMIALAPQNPSPWNYLRGVLRKAGGSGADLEAWAAQYVGDLTQAQQSDDLVKSSHALEFLSDIWAEQNSLQKAEMALILLADKYDCIRANYWRWKSAALRNAEVTA